MPAGIELFNSVLNQLGSPALYSDIFANRPAFGYTGRLFISTDTNEIYRDTGTSWVLISGGGSPVNIYNSNGTLTAARTMTMAGHNLTFEGGASAARLILSANNNVGRIFSFRTAGVERWAFRVDGNETGSNAGGDWALRAYNDAGTFIFAPITVRRRTGEIECFADENITTGAQAIIGLYTNTTGTYSGGLTTTGGNPQSSTFNIFTLANGGNVTFANSNLVATTVNVLVAQANNAGTVTFPASATSALRSASNYVSQLQYNTGAAALTYTHAANLHLQGIYERVGGNAWTVTNAYQLLINGLNENGYTGAQLVLTNRWGIYQDSTLDPNYFGSRVQIGSTTSTGETLQVTGTARVTQSAYFATASGNVGVGTTVLTAKFNVLVQSDNDDEIARFARVNNAGTDSSLLRIYADPVANTARIDVTGTNNTSLALSTVATERMRIFANGNVAIGTTIDAGYKLDVVGDAQIQSSNGTSTVLRMLQNGVTAWFIRNIGASGSFEIADNAQPAIFILGGSKYNVGIRQTTFGTNAERTFAISTGVAPASSPADCFQLYSADITAGNAAAHFRTENGAVVKIYQETTAVAAATLVGGGGTTITDTDTFGGYTLQQIAQALRNFGLLQ